MLAVYAPAGSVRTSAASRLDGSAQGTAPTWPAAAEIAAAPPQPELVANSVLPAVVLKSWSSGSARTPWTPKAWRAGPDARTRRGSAREAPPPPTTKPVIRIFEPVPTMALHERFISRPGSDPVDTLRVAGS